MMILLVLTVWLSTSSGNVGIGTTSPETTLDVKSKYSFNNASNGAIRVQNHSSNAYGSFFNIAGTQLFDNSTYYGSGEFLANGDKSSGIVLPMVLFVLKQTAA